MTTPVTACPSKTDWVRTARDLHRERFYQGQPRSRWRLGAGVVMMLPWPVDACRPPLIGEIPWSELRLMGLPVDKHPDPWGMELIG